MVRTVADVVIDHLVARGTKYLFVGPATNHQYPFLDALYDRQKEITPILVRHEAMAPLMAEGWFRATHTPGVFFVGAGPALANAVLGVMAAYNCGSAVIGISGQVNTRFWGRNGIQEVQGKTYAEGYRILEPVLKRYWQVTRADKVPEVLNQAYSAATTGRPGPVLLDIPMDVFEEDCPTPVSQTMNHLPTGRAAGDPEAVRAAFDLLRAAERPVMLCGAGVSLAEAADEARAFAERLVLPIVTSYTGKGVVAADHPLVAGHVGAMGIAGAMRVVQDADVLLVLGKRFNEHGTSGFTEGLPYAIPPQRMIQVDIEPQEIGRYYPVEIGIHGDVKRVLQQLLALAGPSTEASTLADHPRVQRIREGMEEERRERQARARVDTGRVNPHRVVAELRARLPRDGILLPDAGNNGNYFHTAWDVFGPQTYFTDRGSLAMGYAPAAALGVKLANPNKTVVVVTGDGCMTQVNWVLATAAEYGIDVKFIVLNDSALSGCVAAQQNAFAGRVIATRFERHATGEPLVQDFAMLARSYTVPSGRVSTNAGLSDALEVVLASEGPYLLDVLIDPEARPKGVGRMVISSKAAPPAGTPAPARTR